MRMEYGVRVQLHVYLASWPMLCHSLRGLYTVVCGPEIKTAIEALLTELLLREVVGGGKRTTNGAAIYIYRVTLPYVLLCGRFRPSNLHCNLPRTCMGAGKAMPRNAQCGTA